MSSFADQLTIIRRFLRDPNGDVWTDYDVLTYWNDALLEIARKVGYIEKVHTYKYPPEWSNSYIYDFEYEYTNGDRYQALSQWQARSQVITYPWEPGYFLTNSDVADDGSRFTHPWEAFYSSPADYVPSPFHFKFHRAKYIAYDEETLTYASRKSLSSQDSHYRTAQGGAICYWRPDETSNQIVLYPRPSGVTFDDGGLPGSPIETYSDTGGIQTWDEAYLDERDTGIITEAIETEKRIFMVFEAIPNLVPDDPGSWYEDIDFPAFMLKHVRYATLERCFGADTDGFIPSLRDFWNTRKEIGISIIKKYKSLRMTDRIFVLGGGMASRVSKHPRLPSSYPRQSR
jgi:hypothetical protein